MYVKSLGSLDITRSVVDEESLGGNEFFALDDGIEKLRVGLHRPTLITLVGGIKVICEGMSHTIECIAHHPRHHKGVGVGEQYDAVSTQAQLLHLLEIALGHIAAISLPCMQALLPREFTSYENT